MEQTADVDGPNQDGKKSGFDANGNKIKRKRKGCFKCKKIPIITSASKKIELIVEHDTFTNMITAFIILNTLFLSCE